MNPCGEREQETAEDAHEVAKMPINFNGHLREAMGIFGTGTSSPGKPTGGKEIRYCAKIQDENAMNLCGECAPEKRRTIEKEY